MARTKGWMGGIKSRTKGGTRYFYTYQNGKQVSLGTDSEKAKEQYRVHDEILWGDSQSRYSEEPPATQASIVYLFTCFDEDNQARLKARYRPNGTLFKLPRFSQVARSTRNGCKECTSPSHPIHPCIRGSPIGKPERSSSPLNGVIDGDVNSRSSRKPPFNI